jgi:hypothetical protein
MSPRQVGEWSVARRRAVCSAAVVVALVGVWLMAASGRASAIVSTGEESASISKVVNFEETGRLQKVSKNGASFVERGPASGTYTGSLTLYLTTTSKGVRFRMKGKNRSGSLLGHGSAVIKSRGKIGKVSGRADFTDGTGGFTGAHGEGLAVTGTFNRETYFMVVTLTGHLHS